MEGLTLQYAVADVVGDTTLTSGDNTQMKATYAYGPVTVGYSVGDHDEETTNGSGDIEMTSMAVTYTVTDELSITYGQEESERGSASSEVAEISAISFAYTAGGMTISATSAEAENISYTTGSTEDQDYWGLTLAFAF